MQLTQTRKGKHISKPYIHLTSYRPFWRISKKKFKLSGEISFYWLLSSLPSTILILFDLSSSVAPWLRRCRPFLWQHCGYDRVRAVPRAKVLLAVHHASHLRSKFFLFPVFSCFDVISFHVDMNAFHKSLRLSQLLSPAISCWQQISIIVMVLDSLTC